MEIDGIGPHNRPGDPGGSSPFLGEDLPEAAAGTTVFAIVGGVIGVGAAGVAAVPILVGATVGGGLYASACGIKWLFQQF